MPTKPETQGRTENYIGANRASLLHAALIRSFSDFWRMHFCCGLEPFRFSLRAALKRSGAASAGLPGTWLKKAHIPRDKLVIASKARWRLRPPPTP